VAARRESHEADAIGGEMPFARLRPHEPNGALGIAELNRMMAFIEKVWKRLVEMIVSTQRDMMKKS